MRRFGGPGPDEDKLERALGFDSAGAAGLLCSEEARPDALLRSEPPARRAPTLAQQKGASAVDAPFMAMAVAAGFEPAVRGCRTRHFECRTFGRSDTLPLSTLLPSSGHAKFTSDRASEVTRASDATRAGAPKTGRSAKAASIGSPV